MYMCEILERAHGTRNWTSCCSPRMWGFSLCLLSGLGIMGLDSEPTIGYREQHREHPPFISPHTKWLGAGNTLFASYPSAADVLLTQKLMQGAHHAETSSQDQTQGSCPLPHALLRMMHLLYRGGFVCSLFLFFLLKPGHHVLMV